jgi:beta-galactosidase
MKIRRLSLWLGLLSVLLGGTAWCRAVEPGARATLPLLDDWRFSKGSADAAAAMDCNDSGWETVALPHSWNAEDGQDGGDYFRGDGWYRRRFQVPVVWTAKRVFLQFDGANRSAEVFLNGRRLGLHRGGFARFRFDATDVLDFAGENTLAVRVNNDNRDNMAPVSGDFTFFGGLYRAVNLVATDPIHIDLLDHASPGVTVRQTRVSAESAELDLLVKLANDTESGAEVVVRTTISDAGGKMVQAVEMAALLAARARGDARCRLVVKEPHLWNAQADPYLYRVRTELVVGCVVRDAVTVPLGLRFFSVDRTRGFLLNGRDLDLRGVNRHQDRPGRGWAIGEAEEQEDFALIEEMGATMIRQSHYQQSQSWTDLADRRGMVTWSELAFVNEVRDNPEFFENAKEQLRELIRQNHHHPAILFWSIGNETFVRDPTAMPGDTNERLLRELAAVVREEDPTRLSTYASNGNVTEPRAGVPDVLGFNHYFGWYHGAPEDFAPWLDAQHAFRPDLRIGMSEYGAGANVAHHEDPAHQPEPGGPWHPEEWQFLYHEVYWQAMAERPWLWCKLVWCMFDFASDGRNEGGTPGINDKGLVTADRKTRKDAFYWYKANWSQEPVLHITSRRFTPRTNPLTAVRIYSNAGEVELHLNGVSLGTKSSTSRVFVWPGVALRDGRNVVEAHARVAECELVDRCEWVCTAAAP